MAFIKRNLKLLLSLFLILAILAIAMLYYLKTSKSPMATAFRQTVKDYLNSNNFPKRPDSRVGLDIISETLYINNEATAKTKPEILKDNKLVITTADKTRLFDYAGGYSVDFPVGTQFDFSRSAKYTTAQNQAFKTVISREWSVAEDVSEYINYYFNRFILDEGFQKANGITLIKNERNDNYEVITVVVENLENKPNMYTYLIFKTNSRFFFRIMFKYDKQNQEMPYIIQNAIDSFSYFKTYGKAVNDVNFYPVIPTNWSAETLALYDKISNTEDIIWGIFAENVQTNGINETIPKIEEKIEDKFGIILTYAHLDEPFPTEFMQKCYAQGRTVELTYQITSCNNENLYAFSPVLDMYRGTNYEQIRNFAKKAKEFGHPFFFRPNNEMNSDWTSYGGVNNLADPDIFIDNWRMIYNIFEEESVDNAIWIFNPNDRDCPPNSWNSFLAYYPGNEYVHMLGITGYNNGSYYNSVTGEYWREFELIYDTIVNEYDGVFDSFPWIITEFSSSSIGGDKVKWIENMFKVIDKYPHLKAAVWFSYADYDFREDYAGTVSRPYWLDETEEVLEAFKKGMHK